MKKVLSFLFFTVALQAQAALRGYWSGYITQQGFLAIATNYQYSLVLETDGETVYGYSEIRLWNDTAMYGRMAFRGTLQGSTVRFVESEILEQRLYSYASWCLKELELEYIIENGREYLRGRWYSDACSGPGEAELQRPIVV